MILGLILFLLIGFLLMGFLFREGSGCFSFLFFAIGVVGFIAFPPSSILMLLSYFLYAGAKKSAERKEKKTIDKR